MHDWFRSPARTPGSARTAIATIRERVIPTLRKYDGFAGYIALYDEDGGRAKGLLLWESKETAEAAEEGELAECARRSRSR